MKLNRKTLSKPGFNNFLTYGVVIVIFALVTALNSAGVLSRSFSGLLVPVCAYIIAALALNLTVGILGELSLGHAGFMSVGAFTGVTAATALSGSVQSEPLRFIIAVVIGALFAALVGLVVGIPVLRLNGDYLAIVTLAFGEIIKTIVTNLYVGTDSNGLHISLLNSDLGLERGGKMILNGPNGISGISKIATFASGMIMILISLIIIFNLVNSKSGRAIMAVRDNRIAAESVGINVTKYKMTAFVISAAIAGAAGVLYGLSQNTVTANKFDFNASILLLVFVVLGSLGNMLGTIVATSILYILPETLLRQFSEYRMLIYAIVLVVVMIVKNNKKSKEFFTVLWNRIKGIFIRKSDNTGEEAEI